jgi:hypothetical protein
MAYRVDRGTLRSPRRSNDGRLIVDGYLTRSGVFVYMNHDGSPRREYRPPDEVFKADSLSTFAMVPVTDDHPPESVTSANARQYAVGWLGESIKRDGNHVAATMVVFDEETIGKMERGKTELSCGYFCDYVARPGVTPEGEHYDGIQTNIRGNHVAVVDIGRAGPTASVRMDAAVQMKENHMGTKDTKKTELTVEAAAAAVASATTRADAAESKLAEETRRADTAEGIVESLKLRIKQLEETRTDAAELQKYRNQVEALTTQVKDLEKRRVDAESPERLRKAVRDRVAIESAAVSILGPSSVNDSMDDRLIMCAVIEKLQGVSVEDSKSLDYVRARFDSAVEGYKSCNDAMTQLSSIVNKVVIEPRKDAQSSRSDMVKRNQNAWRGDANGDKA